MPLPKMPSKPASMLSPEDYPKADRNKPVKPNITLVETSAPVVAPQAVAVAVADVSDTKVTAPRARITGKTAAVAEKPKAAPKSAEARPKSPTSRVADKLGKSKLFVLDTNVLMHDPTSLFRFEEHDIYLPMVTLEELDNHKKGMSEVARNARQISRSLDALVSDVAEDSIDLGIPLAKLGNKDAKGRLYFQTKLQNAALPEGLPEGKADNQILGVVRALDQQYPERPVVLVSKDINMRLKARAIGLPAEDYFNDHVLEDTDLLYSGIQQLPDDFWNKHGKGMESWQESRHGSSYTYYRVTGPYVPSLLVNQFVFIEPKNGEPAFYGQVSQINGKTAVLQTLRDFGHAKNSVWGITARNREQNFALNLLMNPECDFVTLLGQAGTGKTLLALASGLAQVLETKLYNEIIVTRVTVPVGEDIGFLPGTEEEKMGPWMGAFDDNLEVLNKSDGDAGEWGRAATQDLIRSRIKIKSLNFMRGRTFVNKFLIIDEAQNLTPKQMKTLVTRAGPGTKIVCLGNIAQIDTPYLTEGSSGLTYVVDRFKGWAHSGHVTLARGERSRLADHASDVL
ncbi:PhoH family protein [Herbaspirillum huttiense F1]|uniref:PhoH family protein n=1 Tax=Herbaspirillum huttiense subsp. lycopersici TaxID=3074428 RepID=A0ABU2EFE0_9BURK|nr:MULTISPECIES: PhoH family protein [Herbaspirillum]MBP1312996.1 PhoH-like ATPase [Herbaspirillum sp. 1130]MCO4856760.1 PhoH family protein [Herbaspirillum sp. WGmk3]MDR9846854.1 PhoH family protein [Herbaspirillum huttiense SE1]MDT0355782.1 PhoH family protein [Herbaspirillum huttiense F1]UWE18630.1 PhoH family protein [Herbaspirillum huttiense]